MSKIQFDGVSKSFQVRSNDKGKVQYTDYVAVSDVSITVNEGEFVTIVGPSGSGKTTFLDLLAGLTKPTTGKILLDGKEITGPGLDRGVVFQQYALFPWKTARANVAVGLEAKGVPKKQRDELVQHYLTLVGLKGFEDRYPHELSGGMKQRVAIARSLAYDPEVLLMDEPFAALDAGTRETLQAELLRIWEETKKTIIFITHGIDEAVYLGQRVAVLTSRPGTIKYIVDIPLQNRLEQIDIHSHPDFIKARHTVWNLLHETIYYGASI